MTLGGDTRGVAPVIGFLLVFVVLIVSFSSYQAFVVPSQNADVEFDHNQEVENEMLDLRTAVLDAKIEGERTRATVSLGTRYPSRLIAINPPHPGGTIRTTENQSIAVYEEGEIDEETEVDFTDEIQETRFIEYTPEYSEYNDDSVIRYENTVLYHDYENTNLTLTGQELLSGNTVSLVPVEAEFQESGSGAVSVEPIPGILATESVSNPIVRVPTELGEDDWEELLEDEIEDDDNLDEEDVTVEDGYLTLELTGSYDVEYAPIGINAVPRAGERGEDTTDINPAGEGTVQLSFQERDGDLTDLVFTNRGENVTIEAARINFATTHDASEPNVAELYGPGEGEPSAELFVRDDFQNLDPGIELEGAEDEDPTTTLTLDWNDMGQDAFFVISLEYGTGDTGTYFVGFDTDEPVIQVDIDETETDTVVKENENVDVVATIFNIGGEGDDDIELVLDDTVVDTEEVSMGAGTGDQIRLGYETDGDDVGEIELEVRSDSDSDEVAVLVEELDEGPFFSVDIGALDPVMQGDELVVSPTIENIGDEEDTQDVEFRVLDAAGEVVESDTEEDLSLEAGESETPEFTWQTEENDAGEYEVVVETEDTDDSETVDVLAQADLVSGVDGTISTTGQGDNLRFDVNAEDEVTVIDIDVDTDFAYTPDSEEIDNQEPPVTFEGEERVEVEEFDEGIEIDNDDFVDPDGADIVVVLEFEDGSELELGVAATEQQ